MQCSLQSLDITPEALDKDMFEICDWSEDFLKEIIHETIYLMESLKGHVKDDFSMYPRFS